MKFAYITRTGKTEALVKHVGLNALKIQAGNELMNEPFILFTYTDGGGIIPVTINTFLQLNKDNLKGVIATGNRMRHADTYCFAGDIIAKTFNVPCLAKVDGEGTQEDWELILTKI